MKSSSSALSLHLLALLLAASTASLAHDTGGEATYLGNEGVLVQAGDDKVLFDPFFHNDYGRYQKVPEAMREAMFKGEPPFDDVTAIVVSHAHGDHFDAGDLARYLNAHSGVTLVAPAQAIATLTEDASLDVTASQLRAISLDFGAPPKSLTVGDLQIDSVRIAHAGWPQRRDIENLVFRVRFPAGTTVMHLGDADPNDQHFSPYAGHWKAVETQLAFPPYWFYLSPAGREILDQRIHAQTSVGVHVPVLVPPLLTKTDRDYFTRPGETREIGENSR